MAEDAILVLLAELLQPSEMGRFIQTLGIRMGKGPLSLITQSLLFQQRQSHGCASSTSGECFHISNDIKEVKVLDYMKKYFIFLLLTLLKMSACCMANSTGFT